MRTDSRGEQVVLTLEREEIGRLVAVLAEAAAGQSRAEFFIRTGCSLPNIELLVKCLESIYAGESVVFELPIVAGVERDENPPRPRPVGDG